MDKAALAERYARVRESLPESVKLIAVSKKRTVQEIQALYDLGHRAFGENYPQELRDKQPQLPADIEWHFIGHLQSNKVKYLTSFIHLVHSVDREGLLDELNKRAAALKRTIGVLLQIHIATEEGKQGFAADEVRSLLATFELRKHWSSLRFCGLMGMATNTTDLGLVKQEFDGLAHLKAELVRSGVVDPALFTELSMGMSGDLQAAIASGSTMVRIGTSIFGPRG